MAMDIRRAGKHQIRVEPMEWEGQPRVDIRLWVWAEELGKMIPTKRGLSVRLDQIEDISGQLLAAGRSFNANGVTNGEEKTNTLV